MAYCILLFVKEMIILHIKLMFF